MRELRQRETSLITVEAVEEALNAGDFKRALQLITRQAESFLELGADIPLERLEAWLGLLEAHFPDDPWLLYYRAWAWSTQRNHTLALVTLKRSAQSFAASLPAESSELQRARFLVAMAEGAISEREGLYEVAHAAFGYALELGGLSEPPPQDEDRRRWLEHDPSGFFAFCLRALHLYEELGLVVPTARIYHNLGTRLIDRGEPVAARRFLEQARELRARGGNRLALANTLNSLGLAERLLGLTDRSAAHLEQALQLADEIGHAWLQSYALNNLAEVERDTANLGHARELYAASITIKQQTENVFGLAHSHASLADLHLMAGDGRAALAAAEKAVKLRVPGPDRLENARLLSCRARARLASGTDAQQIADELEELLLDLTALDAKAEIALANLWRSA
ncbi:MAG TPA: tetratricopeptide repeat protein, partial [Candidatus Limnocylindria bacterium]|nr:tetratricopeptide repeat protein [Candidatus Limnocylindria bacterium]